MRADQRAALNDFALALIRLYGQLMARIVNAY
jgi:hypothetical protein